MNTDRRGFIGALLALPVVGRVSSLGLLDLERFELSLPDRPSGPLYLHWDEPVQSVLWRYEHGEVTSSATAIQLLQERAGRRFYKEGAAHRRA